MYLYKITNLKLVKFKHVKLDSQSEFSRALIMEKEKISDSLSKEISRLSNQIEKIDISI